MKLPLQQHSRLVGALLACAAALTALPAQALPSTPTVNTGSISTEISGATLDVAFESAATILDWNSFSIGTGETVNLNQANADATVLNRVVSDTPIVISGNLVSNGGLVLISSHGITLNAGASIQASFIVLSNGLSDADFLAGNYGNTIGLNSGHIDLSGSIKAAKLEIYSPSIALENGSSITAESGITLQASSQISVTGAAISVGGGNSYLYQTGSTSGGSISISTNAQGTPVLAYSGEISLPVLSPLPGTPDIQISPVPEPKTLALLLGGLPLVLVRRMRRRSVAA